MTQAVTLIQNLASEFKDTDYVLVTTDDWTSYLNDAQKQIALVRPDASYSIESITLSPGTLQTLPANGLRLLDITRNMGTDGATPGRPIRATDEDTLNLFNRNWHTATPKTEIKNFIYDERTPKNFYVTPPVHATTAVQIEVKMSVLPAEITDYQNDAISLDEIYDGAIRHWMLHRAYGKESDSPNSAQLSLSHMNSFYALLGLKTRTDVALTPSEEIAQ
jgi:hypothetical protein